MRPTRRLAATCLALVAACTPAVAAEGTSTRYDFLAGTLWYVPTGTLPAVMLDPAAGTYTAIVDQTVWSIESYTAGYFHGIAAVLLKAGGRPIAPVQCMRMLGSVTPDGDVQVSFVPKADTDAEGATFGAGKLAFDGTRWRFTMQMGSGGASLVAHWSYMDRCATGQACASRLPGTGRPIEDLVSRCR